MSYNSTILLLIFLALQGHYYYTYMSALYRAHVDLYDYKLKYSVPNVQLLIVMHSN